jgi:NAD(P)-dependent dehydrogenase (short-subunit alcohol dehydrogenase family)
MSKSDIAIIDRWLPHLQKLKGKTALVTGANSGLGYYTTLGLARKGAHVIMGCRNMDRAREAHDQLLDAYPGLSLEIEQLDLADLASVKQAAQSLKNGFGKLDILCNNAGIMMTPEQRTKDGFEKQFGVNHLGHFALTARLMPLLLNAKGARIVNVSSIYHRQGDMPLDDLNWEQRSYSKTGAYAQSKLANLLFTFELERRLRNHKTDAISVAAHPGYADTNLQFRGPELSGSTITKWVMKLANGLLAQSPAQGALPSLHAAAFPDVKGGKYYGPDGFQEMRGTPTAVEAHANAKDEDVAKALWERSEQLTGVTFDLNTSIEASTQKVD